MKRLWLAVALFTGFWLVVGVCTLLAWLTCEYPEQAPYWWIGAGSLIAVAVAWRVAGDILERRRNP